MKKTVDSLLIAAVLIPLVLLFWPFVTWNEVMSVTLRVIPSVAAQVLLFRAGKQYIVRILPTLLATVVAIWGTYFYFTSPHWSDATVFGLIADYVSPLISCTVALTACLLVKKAKTINNLRKDGVTYDI